MAGPLEAGDLIAFARLAWMVYEYGFTEERSACMSDSQSIFVMTSNIWGAGPHIQGRPEGSLRGTPDQTL